jgi:hypothetical protein
VVEIVGGIAAAVVVLVNEADEQGATNLQREARHKVLTPRVAYRVKPVTDQYNNYIKDKKVKREQDIVEGVYKITFQVL